MNDRQVVDFHGQAVEIRKRTHGCRLISMLRKGCMIKKILFFDDACIFGGHELMTMYYIKRIIEEGAAHCIMVASATNLMLLKSAESAGAEVISVDIPQTSFPFITPLIATLIDKVRLDKVRAVFRTVSPDFVVCVQGGILASAVGLLAARKENLKLASYIPMTQSTSRFKKRWAWIREPFYRYYYSLPDRWITISDIQRKFIASYNVSVEKVSVIQNRIELPFIKDIDKNSARLSLGLPLGRYVMACIGRVSFDQKRQDFLVNLLADAGQQLSFIDLLIVGDGPDMESLKILINQRNIGSRVHLLGWHNDLSHIYAAVDSVVIPSSYEGVPLVMIEAILHGVPVFATRIDGMAEHLPKSWLFSLEDTELEVSYFLSLIVKENHDAVLTRIQDEFRSVFLRDSAYLEFLAAIGE